MKCFLKTVISAPDSITSLAWSPDGKLFAIEAALAQKGITSGWLLGESFGSQPLWALAERASSQAGS